MNKPHASWCLSLPVLSLLAVGCGDVAPLPSNVEQVRSPLSRVTAPAVSDTERTQFAIGQRAFALDAYRALAVREGNVVYSPHSVQVALGMTWAGARGATESQMASALRFGLPQDRLHAAFNALDLDLTRRAALPVEGGGQRFRLRSANALWGQRGYPFLAPFLDTLALHYGAGMNVLDIAADPESARGRINRWVSEQTEARIPELLGAGTVRSSTTLVLTNAVYFNASWSTPFDVAQTAPGPFRTLDGATRQVPTMRRSAELRYAEGEGWQAVELPYVGDEVSMLVILPAEGRFAEVERSLDAARFDAVTHALSSRPSRSARRRA